MPLPKRTEQEDLALTWVTRWNQFAPAAVKRELARRQYAVRHLEHPAGEAYVVDDRDWRFDWAIPALKIAVEIDGGNWMARWSKKLKRCVAVGRHTKSADYEKRNAATEAGWTVFYYTSDMLRDDPEACVEQVAWTVRVRL